MRSLTLFCLLTLITPALHSQPLWHWQNPHPQGSDLHSVQVLDANTVVAVGSFGAILRTTNSGAEWTEISDGETYAYRGLSFPDQNNGWAVGDLGVIIRTTDGGVSWSAQVSNEPFSFLSAVHFTDTQTGTTVGSNGKILRTSDGGATWNLQTSGTTAWLYGVHFTDSQTGTVVGTGGSIRRTTDGGATWNPQTSGTTSTLNDVFFTDASTGTAVGWNGKILRTTDGGANWSSQTSGTIGMLSGVHFTGTDNGVVVGLDLAGEHIFRTTNGGATWTKQYPGTNWSFTAVDFLDATTGYTVGQLGSTFRTTNGGASWTEQSAGPYNSFGGVAFTDANTGTVVGNNLILHTTDAGATWTTRTGVGGTLTGISFGDANNGHIVGNSGVMGHTTNGGLNWTFQIGAGTTSLTDVCFTDALTGTVVGVGGTILRTVNGGATWTPQTSGLFQTLNAVHFINRDTGTIVGSNTTTARILRTTDGGANWALQANSSVFALHDVFFTDANNGWAVGDNGTVIHTTNGGANWGTQSANTTNPLYGVHFIDPLNGRIVGQLGTVYGTTDGGGTWTKQNSRTSNSINDVVMLDASTAVIVADNGCILRQSATDNVSVSVAAGWNLVSRPLDTPDPALSAVYPSADPTYAWAFRSDSGYVRRDSLESGRGYWAKFPAGVTHAVSGLPMEQLTIPLSMGWNIVGSVDHPVAAPTGGIISGSFWGYDAGYTAASTLSPGKGYWVKADAAGDITLGPTASPKPAPVAIGAFETLTIADATGARQPLHIVTGDVDLAPWEMPPLPPAGAFDARFEGNRMADTFHDDGIVAGELMIRVQGARYPVTVTMNTGATTHRGTRSETPAVGAGVRSYTLVEYLDGRAVRRSPLESGVTVVLSPASEYSLGIRGEASTELPTAFSLAQNYPNPFNPRTIIRFGLPAGGFVSLKLYDVLGREVRTLAEGAREPGSHTIEVNASDLPSGVYVYRLRAGDYSAARKLMLLK